MKEVIGLIIFLSFSIIIIYLAVNKQIGTGLASILLGFSILSGFGIANYDLIKKIKWKDIEIETFEREINKIKQDALEKIEREVEKHKKEIEDLTIETNRRREELEILSKNTQKYAFFVIDPFTGTASTGGGHARGGSWATPTDIGNMMGKARTHLDNKQYELALKAADEIEQIFPNFPGAVYMKFLVNKSKGNDKEALELANSLINQISEYGFTEIRPDNMAAVYKYVINHKLQSNQKEEALKIAKEALKHWPDDNDFVKQVE